MCPPLCVNVLPGFLLNLHNNLCGRDYYLYLKKGLRFKESEPEIAQTRRHTSQRDACTLHHNLCEFSGTSNSGPYQKPEAGNL